MFRAIHMTQVEWRSSDQHPECVLGEERAAAETLLRELHDDFRVVLDGDALDFIEFLWLRRHIHWTRNWVEHLKRIDAALPVCLARGARGRGRIPESSG